MEKVDITKPYFFVSYACVDEVQVYTDIRRLQNHGTNNHAQLIQTLEVGMWKEQRKKLDI